MHYLTTIPIFTIKILLKILLLKNALMLGITIIVIFSGSNLFSRPIGSTAGHTIDSRLSNHRVTSSRPSENTPSQIRLSNMRNTRGMSSGSRGSKGLGWHHLLFYKIFGQILIFGQNFDLWPKFRFLVKF